MKIKKPYLLNAFFDVLYLFDYVHVPKFYDLALNKQLFNINTMLISY